VQSCVYNRSQRGEWFRWHGNAIRWFPMLIINKMSTLLRRHANSRPHKPYTQMGSWLRAVTCMRFRYIVLGWFVKKKTVRGGGGFKIVNLTIPAPGWNVNYTPKKTFCFSLFTTRGLNVFVITGRSLQSVGFYNPQRQSEIWPKMRFLLFILQSKSVSNRK